MVDAAWGGKDSDLGPASRKSNSGYFPIGWENKVDTYAGNHQDQKGKSAAFRSNGSAGQPNGAMEGRIHKVALREKSAIGSGVEISLTPIPRRMHSDGEPNVAGAPQAERCK